MKTNVETIQFKAPLVNIAGRTVVQIPEAKSAALPSRGQVSVTGDIHGHEFKTVLEPDGRWSHWFTVNAELQKATRVEVGDVVTVSVTAIKEWPEPKIPDDFQKALDAASDIHKLWSSITPMARWEWIRWVNATTNQDTRARRIEVSLSKMRSGKRRPCCFNLAACTDPDLSKNGRLIEPSNA